MRVDRVFTNQTCNQNCVFCTTRRAEEDRAFVAVAATRERIRAASNRGAKELVLLGGEPTLRRDLPALVAFAREQGAERVTLETNGMLVDEGAARTLVEAGLTTARVKLPGWGPELDAITRDENSSNGATRAIRAFLDVGARVEAKVTLVASNRDLVGGLPEALAEAVRARAGTQIGLVVDVPTETASSDAPLDYSDAAKLLVALDRSARAAGIALKLSPDSGPPPCMLPSAARYSHLFALAGGSADRPGYRHLEGCARCLVRERCPGFDERYLARHPEPELRPIEEDRARRRLSLVSSVEEQVQRELVHANRRQVDGAPVEEAIVRVIFHCNQSCRFCFVSTHLPAAQDAAVRGAIEDAGRRGARITLSGGEPTLNPELPNYVRLAKRVSRHPVEVQTNAVLLEDASRVEALASAGVDDLFVSLHGATAATSDAVTDSPGTFERTVRGLDNVAQTSIRLILNFVICERNRHELAPWVELVAQRWPKAFANISFVAASTDVVPRDRDLMPRYSDIVPELSKALTAARRLGLELGGFQSMCGLPLCLVPEEARSTLWQPDLVAGLDPSDFVKTETCRQCDLESRCFGLRRGYAELYGTDELRAVTPQPTTGSR